MSEITSSGENTSLGKWNGQPIPCHMSSSRAMDSVFGAGEDEIASVHK